MRVEHILMFVIVVFLLYNLMGSCSCGDGFSVGISDTNCSSQKVCYGDKCTNLNDLEKAGWYKDRPINKRNITSDDKSSIKCCNADDECPANQGTARCSYMTSAIDCNPLGFKCASLDPYYNDCGEYLECEDSGAGKGKWSCLPYSNN
jgi:hypothetical protein